MTTIPARKITPVRIKPWAVVLFVVLSLAAVIAVSQPKIETGQGFVIVNSALFGFHNSTIWDDKGFATAWNDGADSGTNYTLSIDDFAASFTADKY